MRLARCARSSSSARLSEEAGFDVIWYCHDLFLRDAWVTLTAIAAVHQHGQLGTCIVNPFSADPAEIAMHAATLQEYSGGRFLLGIGPGEPQFLDLVGKKQETSTHRAARGRAVILRRLLAGEAVPFDGTVFRHWRSGAHCRGRRRCRCRSISAARDHASPG